MDNETLFYVTGALLAGSAVVFSLLALRLEKFPGRAAPIVALWFIVLVGSVTTFAVLHAKDEKEHKEHALSETTHEAEEEEAEVVDESAAGDADEGSEGGGSEGHKAEKPAPEPKAKSPGGTLKLAASPTALAFNATSLESKPGKVTIDLSNPSSIEHDVAIEQDGKEIAGSETVTEGDTSVSVELAPGAYTFLCTVPGHAEAGMEGTLTVK
ncbi:MAG: plastocyanin/azurin family copper-binding protein [Solirubrobacterales bacterium]